MIVTNLQVHAVDFSASGLKTTVIGTRIYSVLQDCVGEIYLVDLSGVLLVIIDPEAVSWIPFIIWTATLSSWALV